VPGGCVSGDDLGKEVSRRIYALSSIEMIEI
jgi:hypothetical protein